MEYVIIWLTTLSVVYILYPLLFVKNLKMIPSYYIIPQYKLKFGDLLLPLISIFLFLGGSALGVYTLTSKMLILGGNIPAILLCLCMGVTTSFMRFYTKIFNYPCWKMLVILVLILCYHQLLSLSFLMDLLIIVN